MTRVFPDVPAHHERLLDREALRTPRRLSREEHRALAGPDWVRTRTEPDEEETDV
jgi:hypothetical protein